MKSFYLELKSLCKSFKFLAFILVLISYQAMLANQFDSQSVNKRIYQLRSNERYLSENRSMVEYWEKRERLVLEEGPEAVRFSWTRIQADLAWYRYETKLAEKISQAYLEG